MPYYAVTRIGGSIGIRWAQDEAEARREARRELGSYDFGGVRLATDDDLAWVEAMGGRIPPEGGGWA